MEERIGWGIGRGLIPIHENWLFDSSISLPCDQTCVSMLFADSMPNEDLILSNYGSRVLKIIKERHINISDQQDTLLWMPASSGIFSTNSAWKECRKSKSRSMVFASCWHKHLPLKISVFLWKALHNALPLDANIQGKGISMASMCSCCLNHDLESLDHLFIYGDVASQAWDFYSMLFRCTIGRGSLRQLLCSWWFGRFPRMSGMVKWLCSIIPGVICWELRKQRNRSRFEGVNMNAMTLIKSVKMQIHDIIKAYTVRSSFTIFDHHIADFFMISMHAPRMKRIRIVRWMVPPDGWFKLNTDGVSRGNPGIAAGGGLLRDCKGDILVGFANFYGHATNMWAEVKAALDGLLIAHEFGIASVRLEVDSMVLVNCLVRSFKIPWAVWSLVARIQTLMKIMNIRISHILREGNQVADGLANLAADSSSNVSFSSFKDLPCICKGAFRLDREGFPYIRSK